MDIFDEIGGSSGGDIFDEIASPVSQPGSSGFDLSGLLTGFRSQQTEPRSIFDQSPEEGWLPVIGKSLMQAPVTIAKGLGAAQRASDELLGLNHRFDKIKEKYGEDAVGPDLYEVSEEAMKFWQPDVQDGSAKSYASQIVRTLGEMGTAAALTGGAGILPVMAGTAGASKYQEAREGGAGKQKALEAGIGTGAIEYATEKLPLDILKKPGLSLVQRLLKGLVSDVPGEVAATVSEMAAIDTAVLGKSYTKDQYLQAIKDTIIVAAGTTGGATAISHAYQKATEPGKLPEPSPADLTVPDVKELTGEKKPAEAPIDLFDVVAEEAQPAQEPIDLFDTVAEEVQPEPVAAAPSERRGNEKLRAEIDAAEAVTKKKLREMTPEEQHWAVFGDKKVGGWNGFAYETMLANPETRKPLQVAIDVDGLKWVNDNFGHGAGDAYLKSMVEAFDQIGVPVYRTGGDEFFIQAEAPEEVEAMMGKVRDFLSKKVFEGEDNTTKQVTRFQGAEFSYGIGADQHIADKALYAEKERRKEAGLRNPGKKPPTIKILTEVKEEAITPDLISKAIEDESRISFPSPEEDPTVQTLIQLRDIRDALQGDDAKGDEDAMRVLRRMEANLLSNPQVTAALARAKTVPPASGVTAAPEKPEAPPAAEPAGAGEVLGFQLAGQEAKQKKVQPVQQDLIERERLRFEADKKTKTTVEQHEGFEMLDELRDRELEKAQMTIGEASQTPDQKVAKRKITGKKKVKKSGDLSLAQFVKAKGGLSTDPKKASGMVGELKRLSLRQAGGGINILNNKTGVEIDRMRMMAAEAGYLPWDSTLDDFLTLLEKDFYAIKTNKKGAVYSKESSLEDQLNAEQQLFEESQFRAVNDELGKAVDEAVGDATPQLGFTTKALTPVQAKKLGVDKPGFEATDPEVTKRFRAAQGIKPESWWSSILAKWESFKHKATRTFEHLPNTAEFAQLKSDLLELSKAKESASYKTLKAMQGITVAMNAKDYDLFTWKVIVDDLIYSTTKKQSLPFGFTPESLKATYTRLEQELAGNDTVLKAVESRGKVWKAIRADYIKAMDAIGFDVSERFENENYFRHQVIEYASLKGRPMGTGQKLKTPANRSYMKKRSGSELDINTDYIQAEHEVMAQMLYDIKTAKTILGVDHNYNIVNQLKRDAKAQNEAATVSMFPFAHAPDYRLIDHNLILKHPIFGDAWLKYSEHARNIQRMGTLPGMAPAAIPAFNPLKPYEQRIAWSLEELHKILKAAMAPTQGTMTPSGLSVPPEYLDTVMRFTKGQPRDMKKWFAFLSWLGGTQFEGAVQARTIFKTIQGKNSFMKDFLKENFKTFKDILPEGYRIWQPREGNVFFMADSIPAQLAQQLTEEHLLTLGITKEDLVKVIARGGRYREFVVKDEVADTLDNLTKGPTTNFLAEADKKLIRTWKQWTLLSPRRFFKYNFRNLTGDADALFVGNPSAFKKVPRAARELLDVMVGNKAMTPDMQDWFEKGGMGSTLQAQEIGDLNKLKMFLDLYEKKSQVSAAPLSMWQKYWNGVRLTTDYREAILRYAAYLDFLEQVQANPQGRPQTFGASVPEEIMALKDPKTRAFWLSNDLLGAYDKVSVAGHALREHLYPFWSWKEVNFKRYIQLAKNAYNSPEATANIGRMALRGVAIKSPVVAFKVGMFSFKAGLLWGLLQAWNMAMFPDAEKELPDEERARPHIILGRSEDGTILNFTRLGALGDFLGWFGMDAPAKLVADYMNGKRTLGESLRQMALSPVNIIAQGAHPFIKTAGEVLTRQSIFPDVSKPAVIRDRGVHIARSLGVEPEYREVMGLPSPGYGKSLKNIALYQSDPGQSAYYDIFERKQEYLHKIGKGRDGFILTDKGQALYNLKLGLRYKDKEAVQKYMAEYLAFPGADIEGIERSLKNMDPLAGLNTREQNDFYKTLTSEEKEKLRKAADFYNTVILNKDMLQK